MAEFTPTLDNDFAQRLAEKAKDALVFAADAKAQKKNGLQGLAEPGGQIYRINPVLIKVEPNWNSRDFELVENQIHITNLASSIAAEGVKVPLTVAYKNNEVWLKDGECRLRAVWYAISNLGAEIQNIPVMLENKFESEQDSLIGQFVRNAGKPFTPIEAGKHFKRLLAFMDLEEIGRRVGLHPSRVRQLLELWAAPEEIKAMVASGEISSTQAISTLQSCHGDATKAVEVLQKGVEKAKKEGKTRATAQHLDDPTTRGITAKKLLAKIIGEAYFEINETTGKVTLEISTADWDAIKKALKL